MGTNPKTLDSSKVYGVRLSDNSHFDLESSPDFSGEQFLFIANHTKDDIIKYLLQTLARRIDEIKVPVIEIFEIKGNIERIDTKEFYDRIKLETLKNKYGNE